MNFFADQDKARRTSVRLVALFLLALVAIVCAVYFAAMLAFVYLEGRGGGYGHPGSLWNPQLFLTTAAVVGSIILVKFLFKTAMLARGGSYVAESLGGRLVHPETKDPGERRLLNVVEEMSIASGIPLPTVYVLEQEEGINAFAAGYTPNDAAVAVTKGCLNQLNRDELQGVIAHEFSHILNGDMRLNIRTIALISGIMALSTVGYLILRLGPRSRKSGAAVVIMGLALLIIGYAGLLCGRLIQASLSRQREYLADASAVQFTRNPLGIAEALKKIGGFASRSRIQSLAAGETRHLFFSSPEVISSLTADGGPFATHPPLAERIKRLDPSFNPELATVEAPGEAAVAGSAGAVGFAPGAAEPPRPGRVAVTASEAARSLGAPSEAHVVQSARLLAEIPSRIKRDLGDPLGASAVVCALLLDQNEALRNVQYDLLAAAGQKLILAETKGAFAALQGLNPTLRLALLDLALPGLRQMSKSQYQVFLEVVRQLINADSKVTLFEFALLKVLEYRLAGAFDDPKPAIKNLSPELVDRHLRSLLLAVAYAGNEEELKARATYGAVVKMYLTPNDGSTPIPSRDEQSLELVGKTLDTLRQLAMRDRRRVFEAVAACVLFDDVVTLEEAELLRVITYALGMPLPPFLPPATA